MGAQFCHLGTLPGCAADGVGKQVVPAARHDLEEVVGAESLVAAAADVEPAVPGHDVQSGTLLGSQLNHLCSQTS